ncbi:uncharacterized protein MONOS_5793 [Monocercomonoides exilis]|uniref:uncharacterized protein n=1 Tax=Monocercomonoides exilis TaxID=2049356 RepID=UPI00355A1D94|nr:hypothetical protein MONOS_5793 [Monocercomonoides exilis]|eukprot:MONOS_5793.1-p1 / transcript=MONOS_5793.1 / gene=MONOS_5793 / organism=Monocercomonoides_exilis_PA203 / gene_product=unspecified product / transcript_product=unspecified product / location=Mono_scaffold00173:74483-79684(-) / protein_length=1734 / sequence_SO=supercontig / SO=protein_coding / is_pseudo=false
MRYQAAYKLLNLLEHQDDPSQNPKASLFAMNELLDDFKSGELKTNPPSSEDLKVIEQCLRKIIVLQNWPFNQNIAIGIQHYVLDLPIDQVLKFLGIVNATEIDSQGAMNDILMQLGNPKREVRDAFAQLIGSLSSVYPLTLEILLKSINSQTKWESLEGHLMAIGWAGRKCQQLINQEVFSKMIEMLLVYTNYSAVANFSNHVRYNAFRAFFRILIQKNLALLNNEQINKIGESVLNHITDSDINVRKMAAEVAPIWLNWKEGEGKGTNEKLQMLIDIMHKIRSEKKESSQTTSAVQMMSTTLAAGWELRFGVSRALTSWCENEDRMKQIHSGADAESKNTEVTVDTLKKLFAEVACDALSSVQPMDTVGGSANAAAATALTALFISCAGRKKPREMLGATHVRGEVKRDEGSKSTADVPSSLLLRINNQELQKNWEEVAGQIAEMIQKDAQLPPEVITKAQSQDTQKAECCCNLSKFLEKVFDTIVGPVILNMISSPNPSLIDAGCQCVMRLLEQLPTENELCSSSASSSASASSSTQPSSSAQAPLYSLLSPSFIAERIIPLSAAVYRCQFHAAFPIRDIATKTFAFAASVFAPSVSAKYEKCTASEVKSDKGKENLVEMTETEKEQHILLQEGCIETHSCLTRDAALVNADARETVFKGFAQLISLRPIPKVWLSELEESGKREKKDSVLHCLFNTLVGGMNDERGGPQAEHPRAAAIVSLGAFFTLLNDLREIASQTDESAAFSVKSSVCYAKQVLRIVPSLFSLSSTPIATACHSLLRSLCATNTIPSSSLLPTTLPFILQHMFSSEMPLREAAISSLFHIAGDLRSALCLPIKGNTSSDEAKESNGTIMAELVMQVFDGERSVSEEDADDDEKEEEEGSKCSAQIEEKSLSELLKELKSFVTSCAISERVNGDYSDTLCAFCAVQLVARTLNTIITDFVQQLNNSNKEQKQSAQPSLIFDSTISESSLFSNLCRCVALLCRVSVAMLSNSSIEEPPFEAPALSTFNLCVNSAAKLLAIGHDSAIRSKLNNCTDSLLLLGQSVVSFLTPLVPMLFACMITGSPVSAWKELKDERGASLGDAEEFVKNIMKSVETKDNILSQAKKGNSEDNKILFGSDCDGDEGEEVEWMETLLCEDVASVLKKEFLKFAKKQTAMMNKKGKEPPSDALKFIEKIKADSDGDDDDEEEEEEESNDNSTEVAKQLSKTARSLICCQTLLSFPSSYLCIPEFPEASDNYASFLAEMLHCLSHISQVHYRVVGHINASSQASFSSCSCTFPNLPCTKLAELISTQHDEHEHDHEHEHDQHKHENESKEQTPQDCLSVLYSAGHTIQLSEHESYNSMTLHQVTSFLRRLFAIPSSSLCTSLTTSVAEEWTSWGALLYSDEVSGIADSSSSPSVFAMLQNGQIPHPVAIAWAYNVAVPFTSAFFKGCLCSQSSEKAAELISCMKTVIEKFVQKAKLPVSSSTSPSTAESNSRICSVDDCIELCFIQSALELCSLADSASAKQLLPLFTESVLNSLAAAFSSTLSSLFVSLPLFNSTISSQNINHTHIAQIVSSLIVPSTGESVIPFNFTPEFLSNKTASVGYQAFLPYLLCSAISSFIKCKLAIQESSLLPLFESITRCLGSKQFRSLFSGQPVSLLTSALVSFWCSNSDASLAHLPTSNFAQSLSDVLADPGVTPPFKQPIIDSVLSLLSEVSQKSQSRASLNLPTATPIDIAKENETFSALA